MNFLKVLFGLVFSLLITSSFAKGVSSDDAGKTVYGYRVYDYDKPFERGPVSFNLNTPDVTTLIRGEVGDLRRANAGAFFDGYLYVYIHDINDIGMIEPLSFSKIDLHSGEENVIADYSSMTFLFEDMTYDYTTNTMFYIANEGNVGKLGRVNVETGAFTHIANISTNVFTIAADAEGQLYTITSNGSLAKLDKANGKLTVVGSTGIMPTMQLQSMDFDRDDNTLYWAIVNNAYQTGFCKVNTSTGAVTMLGKGLGFYSQITSLYIPFTPPPSDVPDSVTDLNVIAEENGGLDVSISFKTPTKEIGGDNLTSISKIEVFRNDVSIKIFNEPEIGEVINLDDSVLTADLYLYKIAVSNESGEGKPAFKSVFIGEDVPMAPSNVTLTCDGTKAILNWTSPQIGIHDGWVDAKTLSYNITRLPDSVTFKTTANSYTDESITDLKAYHYEVESETVAGVGGIGISNKLVIGNALDLPYSCTFNSEDKVSIWNIVDANEDEFTWAYNAYANAMVYVYEPMNSNAANDWLISPKMNLKVGSKYKISFVAASGMEGVTEKLELYCGKGTTVADQTKLISSFNIENTNYQSKTLIMEVETDGEYNFGFRVCSDPNAFMLFLNSMEIKEIFDNDLTALDINGDVFPMVNNKSIYKVTIKNNGSMTQNLYKVQIVDADNNVLNEVQVNDEIKTNAQKVVSLEFVPSEERELKIRGRVVLSSDQDLSNNDTKAITINVQPNGNQKLVTLSNGTEKTVQLPFNFYYKHSVSQTIYPAKKMNVEKGLIKNMTYSYNNESGKEITNKRVKIYIAHTSLTTLLDGWIAQDKFTLVYDGEVSVPVGASELSLMLEDGFEYEGGNICIMTVREIDENMDDYVYAFAEISTYGCTKTYFNDKDDFDFTQEGISLVLLPNLKMLFRLETPLVINHNIIATAEKGGTITPAGEIKVEEGSDVTFTITPDYEYIIKDVLVNNVSVGAVNTYTFNNVTSDQTINAIFQYYIGVEESIDANLSVFPNPFTNILNIDGEYISLKIYDVANRVVMTSNGNSKVDVSSLTNGTYILKVNVQGGVKTFKIVK